MNINIRQANEKDIPFLVETVIAAERSNTSLCSYSTLFRLNNDEVIKKLSEIIYEDITGQELCISGFYIAEINGQYASACCSWIESEDGIPSSIIKSNLLLWYFGKSKCENIAKEFPFLNDLFIERNKNYIQIESVYTRDEFRGKGIAAILIRTHIFKKTHADNSLQKAQLIVAGGNENAITAYKKIGFKIKLERSTADINADKYLPSCSRILMESSVDKIINKI